MRAFVAVLALGFAAMFTSATRAEIKTKEIEYKQGDVVLQGTLAWDDAVQGKRPGILVVPEWWGLTQYPKDRAKQLAQLGYVAFACDMYGKGVTTSDPAEAGKLAGAFYKEPKLFRERAAAGLKVLTDQPQTDATKLGAIGYCFGGTTVLQLACSGADVKAVVSFHGSLFKPSAEDAKAVKASVLICNGAADVFIDPESRKGLIDAFEAAKVDYVFVDYAGAVHGFTRPDAGSAAVKGVAYDAKADKRSWEDMKAMFAEAFGPR